VTEKRGELTETVGSFGRRGDAAGALAIVGSEPRRLTMTDPV